MRRISLLLLCLIVAAPAAAADQKPRPMKLDDLFRVKRVSDPQISPDGKQVVYVITQASVEDNKLTSTLWLSPTDKSAPRQLTNTTKKDKHPRWSPDGKRILFESTRSGDSQLWMIDVSGGEARQITSIVTGSSYGTWSPDGKQIAFISAVWPEYSAKPYKEFNEASKQRKEEADKNPVKARVFRQLFFRHWDDWVEDKRQHLFVMPAPGPAETPGDPRDLTPGDRDAYPTSDTFAVGDDFTFSPDSKFVIFTGPPEREEAWSTDYNLFRVSITGGPIQCLTKANKAADGAPQFSPDGKHLVYRTQKRAGFEADKWELTIVDTDASGTFKSKPSILTEKFDFAVDEFVWLSDKAIVFAGERKASKVLYAMRVDLGPIVPSSFPAPNKINDNVPTIIGTGSSLSGSSQSGRLAFTRSAFNHPNDVYVTKKNFSALNVSQANRMLLAELHLTRPESVTVPGAGGTPMQMWIIKPPDFDAKKKWPLVYLVHGGPQGAWLDEWSYRWNPQLWAAQGYVMALPNPRGSTGFGQKYVDEISGDWGGKCYQDLMAGLAYLEKLPYIDTDRMAAAGASFGGYMMNWFQGHTTKFKTLISHAGVYNFDSMYALTDELWFDEWEHGGTPWEKRDSYEKYSPHRFAKNFKTPMLIIHNDMDFRVPTAEGFQLFTTLQRLRVPSRMINFPDEGHWVLKPANSQFWHKEIFGWLQKYVPAGGR